jgi:hypothetical protein
LRFRWAEAGRRTVRPGRDDPRGWLGQARVDDAVRALRPDYTALLIVAEGLSPGPSDDATDALLREAEDGARAVLGGREPAELPAVAD